MTSKLPPKHAVLLFTRGLEIILSVMYLAYSVTIVQTTNFTWFFCLCARILHEEMGGSTNTPYWKPTPRVLLFYAEASSYRNQCFKATGCWTSWPWFPVAGTMLEIQQLPVTELFLPSTGQLEQIMPFSGVCPPVLHEWQGPSPSALKYLHPWRATENGNRKRVCPAGWVPLGQEKKPGE